MRIFLARARLAVAITIPAWLLITLLLKLWQPVIAGRPEWQVAAIIVPQMIIAMVFVIIPVTQGFFLRREMRRQAPTNRKPD